MRTILSTIGTPRGSMVSAHRSLIDNARQRLCFRTLGALVLLVAASWSLACNPCGRVETEWNEELRRAMIQTAGGDRVMDSPVSHIVLNVSESLFDDFVSANLELVDPPDATTDIPFLDENEEQVGEATLSVQLRPNAIRVAVDDSVFLHSQLNAVVQVDVPGRRQTLVLEGQAKTQVTLTPDEEDPSRTIIRAGGLDKTSIALPNREMPEDWSEAFREQLRTSTARLVARSTSNVRRAIDVVQIIAPEPSTVDLQIVITGFRQPRGSDRVLIEMVTNLRVEPESIDLSYEMIQAEKDELVMYLHPGLPRAWLRLALVSNPEGYTFDSEGVVAQPPGYQAIPIGVSDTSSDEDDADVTAEFGLYRYASRPCQLQRRSAGTSLADADWTDIDLATFRMASLESFVQRAIYELLFGGRISLGTRELLWTPTIDSFAESDVWRFSGTYEMKETTLERGVERERRRRSQ